MFIQIGSASIILKNGLLCNGTFSVSRVAERTGHKWSRFLYLF